MPRAHQSATFFGTGTPGRHGAPPQPQPATASKLQTEWSYKSDPVCINNSQLLRQERRRERRRLESIESYTSTSKHGGNGINGAGELLHQRGQRHHPSTTPGEILVTEAEIEDVKRCFYMADVTQDGYLSCEELKNFMEYRRRPITHVEAKKLLRQTDPVFKSFIDLDQILFLVYNCGLTTDQEVRLTTTEHENLLQRLHKYSEMKEKEHQKRRQNHVQVQKLHGRGHDEGHHHQDNYHRHQEYSEEHQHRYYHDPTGGGGTASGSSSFTTSSPHFHSTRSVTVIRDNIELDGAISYFEDMANEVVEKQTEEKLYDEYRRGLREQKIGYKNTTDKGGRAQPKSKRGVGVGHDHGEIGQEMDRKLRNYYPPPPGWKNMVLPSQDPTSHQPINFGKVKGEWESITFTADERRRLETLEREKSMGIGSPAVVPEESSIDKIKFPSPPPVELVESFKSNGKPLEATGSKSFATELREVLKSYKEKADAAEETTTKVSTADKDKGKDSIGDAASNKVPSTTPTPPIQKNDTTTESTAILYKNEGLSPATQSKHEI